MNIYTVREASQILEVSEQMVRNYCNTYKLGFKKQSLWLITENDVEYMKTRVGKIGKPQASGASPKHLNKEQLLSFLQKNTYSPDGTPALPAQIIAEDLNLSKNTIYYLRRRYKLTLRILDLLDKPHTTENILEYFTHTDTYLRDMALKIESGNQLSLEV